jgi:hypothetical protein
MVGRTRGGLVVRTFLIVGWCLFWAGTAFSQHNHHEHGGGSNPLSCDLAAGESCYFAEIDDFHSPASPHPDAHGVAYLALNAAQTELRYHIEIDGLSLKSNPAERTAPDDVIGIHLHLFVPDTVGPHVLNIFGLATFNVPAEEDADLLVDYGTRTLSGIYDNSDATIDPTTGQPYLPFFPLTSKPLTDWLEQLDAGDLMVAVHTNATGFPTMAIHGHIARTVPEPGCGTLVGSLALVWLNWRRRCPGTNCRVSE